MAFLSAYRIKEAANYPITCKIVLLHEKQHYVPGDYIEGKLIVCHRKEIMTLQGIKVAIEGTSFAKFKEREQIQHKNETFLDEGVYVFGKSTNKFMEGRHGAYSLPPGTHSYSFKIQIPTSPQLPSSFKSSIGFILYQVLAIVHVGGRSPFKLKKAEKRIDFRGRLEIGPEPPIEFEKVERGCGGGGTPCPRYLFKVPTSGLVAGRDLEFEMRADNCPHKTKQCFVSLVLKTTYHGGSFSRAWKDTYTVVTEVLNNEMDTCWRGTLPIGRQVKATFTGGIVEFRYVLRATLEWKGETVFKCEKPIKIGTTTAGEENETTLGHTLSEMTGDGTGAGRRSPVPFDLETQDNGRPGSSASLPSYSMLSLRARSFETLPPAYDEIQHFYQEERDSD